MAKCALAHALEKLEEPAAVREALRLVREVMQANPPDDPWQLRCGRLRPPWAPGAECWATDAADPHACDLAF